jgi:ATP-dependent Clp protease adapter protein ClpS
MRYLLDKKFPLSAINANENPFYDEEEEVSVGDETKLSARVILFNDEWHTFDEVIDQILKAIRCSYDRAEALTWEVHSKGKACVYEGEMHECLRVSNVLEEISLHTQIEY